MKRVALDSGLLDPGKHYVVDKDDDDDVGGSSAAPFLLRPSSLAPSSSRNRAPPALFFLARSKAASSSILPSHAADGKPDEHTNNLASNKNTSVEKQDQPSVAALSGGAPQIAPPLLRPSTKRPNPPSIFQQASVEKAAALSSSSVVQSGVNNTTTSQPATAERASRTYARWPKVVTTGASLYREKERRRLSSEDMAYVESAMNACTTMRKDVRLLMEFILDHADCGAEDLGNILIDSLDTHPLPTSLWYIYVYRIQKLTTTFAF